MAKDLSGFEPITPCGLSGVEMTSVAREGGPDDPEVIAPIVLHHFAAGFGYPGWQPLEIAA